MYLHITYILDDSFLLEYDAVALCGRIPTCPFKSACPTKFRSEIHHSFLAFPIFSSSPTRCTFPDFTILIRSLRGYRIIHKLLLMKCPILTHFCLLPYLQLCSWALSSVLCVPYVALSFATNRMFYVQTTKFVDAEFTFEFSGIYIERKFLNNAHFTHCKEITNR